MYLVDHILSKLESPLTDQSTVNITREDEYIESDVLYRSRLSQHAPFEVEVGSQPYLGRSSFTERPHSSQVLDPGFAKAVEGAEKGKGKGRFQIVEEDAAALGKRGAGKSTSVASMDSPRSTHISLPLQLRLHVTTCTAGVFSLLHILPNCNAEEVCNLPHHEDFSFWCKDQP